MSRRFLIFYSVAWLPAAALYVAAIYFQSGDRSMSGAVFGGIQTTIVAAALGLIVWRQSIRLAERPKPLWKLVLAHALLSLGYTLLWTAIVMVSIAVFAPREVLGYFARYAMGWQIMTGLFVYGMVAGIAHAIAVGTRLQRERDAAARAEALLARAELNALRAQVNPHFLFNTLHSISALVHTDPGAVEDALEKLAGVLRRLLDVNRSGEDQVTLAEEWEIVRDQLELERLRFGERLRIVTEIEADALDCRIPVFTLQPLVENALRHAVGHTAQPCTIGIAARVAGETLELEVRDDGPGTDQRAALHAPGLGLRAVRQRLLAQYGDRAGVHVSTAPGQGFLIRVTLPANVAPAVRREMPAGVGV